MSIFSNIRKSRQQAKEHNAKLAEQRKKEEGQAPYKHVPTHAAADAIASAPPSWRESDRPRIMEQNRRRSAMAATGHHMNMPGIPRVGSSLSHVSYPTNDASPMVRLPRTYSYNGISPYPERVSREIVYSVPDVGYLQPAASWKGKEVTRGPGYDVLRVSPGSSRGEPSPAESSTGSSSSQDDLEMRPARPSIRPVGSAEATTTVAASTTAAHRLHPSHSRRPSDVSSDKGNSTNVNKPTNTSRDSRPPPSMRGFNAIPAVSSSQGGASLSTHLSGPALSHSNPHNVPHGNARHSSSMASSRQNSVFSLPGLTPSSSKGGVSAPLTPAAVSQNQVDLSLNWLTLPGPELDLTSPGALTATPTAQPIKHKEHSGAPKMARFADTNGAPIRAESQYVQPLRNDAPRAPRPVAHEEIVNVFPEQTPLPEDENGKSGKSKKLSKGSGKLLRKNRWSSSKSSAVAV